METSPVRPGEEIDASRLGAWLGVAGGLTIEQFPGGHSNLTYLVKTSNGEYVLRRPPVGPVAPKAHDMAREYRVLSRVHPVFRAAPRVYRLCEDPSIIGAPFFLMERRHGIVLRGRGPAGVHLTPQLAARVSRGFMDCFVALHAVDLAANDLLQLGKPEGFLERQVHGWSERWRRAKTDDVPSLDAAMTWLAGHIRKSPAPTLVHNDFKLDNLMLGNDDIGRVEAVLDWGDDNHRRPFGRCRFIALLLDFRPGRRASIPQSRGLVYYATSLFGEYATPRTGRDVGALGWHARSTRHLQAGRDSAADLFSLEASARRQDERFAACSAAGAGVSGKSAGSAVRACPAVKYRRDLP